MSTGNPPDLVVPEVPVPEVKPKGPKPPKVVRHIHENAPAADTGKKSGGGVGTVLGIGLGLAVGGALAFGVVMLVKHREKVKAFLFPARRDAPAAEQ